MKKLTREWVKKAEGDYGTASREMRPRKSPNYDAACFHCQQCAEKYRKARLHEAGIAVPKTHDLTLLLNMALAVEPSWNAHAASLTTLTAYAVIYRYPGFSAAKTDAQQAMKTCRGFRKEARARLGIK
jgi:HEPN domain-containing protein